MFERNILLHYLNLEYRRIVGAEKFISNGKLEEVLHSLNCVSILLCKDYCLMPYSTLIEDDIISNIFLKKHYDIFFETGLIRASLREDSPEEFLEKKIEEYDSSPELYGYYKKDALKKLKEQNVLVVKRGFKIGNAIQQKWNDDLENYAIKSVWRDVLTSSDDNNIAIQLKNIPKIIADKGKGIIWPLVNKLIISEDSIKRTKIREVLHNLYFSNYLDKDTMVILTDIPLSISNFSLDNYKGFNFNYNIFFKVFNYIGIFENTRSLPSNELFSLKMSNEFSLFINNYHTMFGECLDHTDVKLNFGKIQKIILSFNKNELKHLNGLDKIKYLLDIFNNKIVKAEIDIVEKSNKLLNFSANQNSDKKFDFGILTALHEFEFEKIETIFNNWKTNQVQDNTKVYLTNTIVKNEDILSIIGSYQLNTGMVEAGIFATEMINRFKPEYLIMSGVLAGKPHKNPLEKTEINLGDIVVGTKLFVIDKGKYSELEFEKDLDAVEIDSKLIQKIRLKRKQILSKIINHLNYLKDNGETCLNTLEIEKLNIHIAPIACSFSVVNKQGYFKDKASAVDRKTIGLEMESYGVARACKLSNNGNTKAIIAKSVMDFSENKDDRNKEIAALTSAVFVKYLIEDILEFKL